MNIAAKTNGKLTTGFDDPTPITREWLMSVGMYTGDVDTGRSDEHEVVTRCTVNGEDRDEVTGSPDEEITELGYYITGQQAYIECRINLDIRETIIFGKRTTRGEMRLLFVALGAWVESES